MSFAIDYFYRWNERIVQTASGLSGGGTGAISTVTDVNLAANKILVADAAGKIAASGVSATEGSYLIGVTSLIQTQLNGKEPTLTKGNLTEVTSSVLTITGNTAAIIGSGLTIRVHAASTSQAGYLSAADWNTFNNKVSTSLASGYVWIGSGLGVATAVNTATGDIAGSTTTGLTIKSHVIADAQISNSAAITRTKLASGSNYRILANDSAGVMSENAPLTASMGVVIDGNGQLVTSSTSAAQVGYSNSLTGNIQSQLDNEIATQTVASIVKSPTITQDGFAITWDNALGQYTLSDPVTQGIPVAGSARQFLGKNSSTNYDCSWLSIITTDISDITASAANINNLTGVTTTPNQFNFLNTLTSNVQTALNNKQSSTLGHHSIWVGNISDVASALSVGSEGQVLTVSGGTPTWSTPGSGGTVTSINVDGGATGMVFTGGPIATTGTITLSGILDADNGGTGFASYSVGSILYANTTTTLAKLSVSSDGYILTLSGGVPVWAPPSAGTGTFTLIGNYDLSVNTFPGTSVLKGYAYFVTVGSTTLLARDGGTIPIGSLLIARVNSPSTTLYSDWIIINTQY